jgi:biopolymer transport protein ExbD
MRHRMPYTLSDDSDATIDMTPMLDVVFIMLIFFIVTTSFVKESGVEVNRPQANTAEIQNSQSIFVAITENNQVWINQHPIAPRAIRHTVERLKAESPESSVIIQADEHSQTGLLVKVMDQVKLAGITNIAIAAHTGNQ